MNILNKLKIVMPFSYMWLLRRSIDEPQTILDLGCGDGNLMEVLSQGKSWEITGVDIFPEGLEKARQKNIYQKLIKSDIFNSVCRFNQLRQKFDVVFLSQVIEHLTREKGEKVLKEIEKMAKKRIIVGTPRGFMHQPEEFLGNNPHQVHQSGWLENDFKSRGYYVYGVGFAPIWSEHGLARNKHKALRLLATVIAYLISPIVYFFPKLGAGIICIKNVRGSGHK